MKTKRISVNRVKNSQYYQLPKFLFHGEFKKGLNSDDRIAYSLLKDRHDLSLANNWVDENGHVFLIFTRAELEELLGRSDKTVKNIIARLEKMNLLDDVRMGRNKANRIYLRDVDYASFTYEKPKNNVGKTEPEGTRNNSESRTRNNSESGPGEFPNQDPENFRPINTESNQTDFYQDQSINHEDRSMDIKYPMKFFLDHFSLSESELNKNKFMKQAINLLFDKLNMSTDRVKLNSKLEIPFSMFEQRVIDMDYSHLLYVQEQMENTNNKISNMQSYLLTSLYNAVNTIDSHYTNRYNTEIK